MALRIPIISPSSMSPCQMTSRGMQLNSSFPFVQHRLSIDHPSGRRNQATGCTRVRMGCRTEKRRGARVLASANQDVAGAAAATGVVTEVNGDTFWPIVNAAEGKIVVLYMYTQRCGPCKVMAPKFEKLSGKCLDVVFLKLDCNEENKPLAKGLGVAVVPTFKILKDGMVVKEVVGAKFDELLASLEAVRS
ncbi:thioredoxin F-type, chloroplastic-like [Nymphaea colorata]|nr:thioredoxin F-type, chloroplastic-like [Nymphaea colorata]